ncbi:hypothetical protein Dxin01_00257 [Deinococcus xinjiangensis]|uniref:Barstar (barnase inhibitor) domain-containing protein n=1 Tax=Deinococcus xinjiangensis TaxID=457454 RepID=A0ABP9V5K4_9DEIO
MDYFVLDKSGNGFSRFEEFSEKHILVEIDGNGLDEDKLFAAYGSQIYSEERSSLNPIFENSNYFGRNYDAFAECLSIAPQAIGQDVFVTHSNLLFAPKDLMDIYFDMMREESASNWTDGRTFFLFTKQDKDILFELYLSERA